ncbi:hypothetical protein [Shewanella gelidii]|uniref:Uncharacterized protein n=1 Tax=Shewanella gelidii TaxID=1642821 RepID=A0A917N933_9GAMM|nr:hypothetical protein [Shewanella gelidii]MCL1097716.1 hypothetical protein [Shewanella gelidii]GGI79329.1 hypothetical protein GCM10009332_15900 [Shewanella gelidii]
MLNINLTKTLQSVVAATVLLGTSVSAQANVPSTSDVMNAIEQNIAAQSQEMLATAKREFMLSVQTQLAESMFEFEVADNEQAATTDQVAKVED